MSIDAAFFNQLYEGNDDPWNFTTNSYELFRYQRICDVIQNKKHAWIFEAGCSIGILTAKLAQFAEQVEAIDISEVAIQHAQKKCQHINNITFSASTLLDYAMSPATDLIILSEIGYYFTHSEWRLILDKIITQMRPNSYILASHWLGQSSDHLISGDAVQDTFSLFSNLYEVHQEQHPGFRLGYWLKK
ncbi:MAG: methyltransferase domain-containing protein [Legionella sp.]|nr:methyltransferase domain-containing protein [Legionella sp.]